ncbi:type II secretion system protein D [Geobacter sp. OR-1]|uniref:type II secretion system secretin GspD n=1 Tax=Geobacter sp. OR-1 TaxID=1266765 RepID=UPI000543C0A5|nr:type II secretion system secretin GspD [Geobacter sp. OR-1]GAM08768.1 type II secretion system protein D [Geobacter sp. OR-1]
MHKRLSHLIIILILISLPVQAYAKGVILNFNDVDISTMVKFISDLTGRNFIMDERVKGKISVYSPTKLSNDEAFNVFTSVLELKGFTVVPSGKVNKIVPISSAKQSGMKVLEEGDRLPVNDSYVARVISLENITAAEAVPFLQPVVSKDGYISAFGPGNLLLVVDSALNIQKIVGLVDKIDAEQQREGAELIFLKNASAESVANVVKDWIGSKDKGGAKPAGQTGNMVLADTRLNALVVFGSDTLKEDVKRLVKVIDIAPPEASSKANVYYLENTDATEMAKVLDGVVKGISVQATTQPGAATPQVSPFESGKITITPDKASNSLVIMASPNDYNNLVQVIKKLDRRSKQVFVQVFIAEVSLDKSRELGMQSGVIGGAALDKYLAVAGIYDPLGTLASVLGSASSTTAVPNLQALLSNFEARPANVTAVLKALDKNGLVNILSTPNILTTDNKEAEINVGENVPFQGSSTVTTGFQTTSVERKDIGINLKIKPQISEGDYIRMDINQEISAVKDSKGQAIDLVTTKRSAKTSIIVKDKETIVIGGLIQDSENEVVTKIPLLGDIPGLGWLFKTKTKTRQKTNLMIMLTPHIVRDAADLAATTQAQRNSFGDALSKDTSVNVREELKIKP